MRDGRPRTSLRRLAAIIALALVAGGSLAAGLRAGGGDGQDGDAAVPEAGARDVSQRRASFVAQLVPPPLDPRRRGGEVPRTVSDLARRLPLERKVAQVFLLGFRGTDLTAPAFERLRRLDLGGITIDGANYLDPQQLASLAGEAGVIAAQEGHVPPLVLAPQEGGDFNVFADLPPASAASDLGDVGAAAAEAAEAAATLRPLGINGVLAPVADLGLAEDPAVGPRAFSDQPEPVARYVTAVVRAYRRAKVLTVVKHFPGLGSASQSTEDGPANVGLSIAELAGRDLIPFRAAVAAGTPAILVGHGLYVTDDFVTPASQSRAVIDGLLRKNLGFRGVAITDDLSDGAITALTPAPDAAVEALRAGADMLYISGPPVDQQTAYIALLRAVRRGEVSRARLDEAVTRILSAKLEYGLIQR